MQQQSPARRERAALASALLEAGPEAPTLCAGWTTRDLAAHLVVREERPDAAIALGLERIRPLAEHGERVRRRIRDLPYDQLVARFAAGPPRLSPFAIPALDRLGNTVEYAVHCEDVRRATPGWRPRVLPADLRRALTGQLRMFGRPGLRQAPVGVTLEITDAVQPPGTDAERASGTDVGTSSGPSRTRWRAKDGVPLVVLSGPVLELLLVAMGRHRHALFDIVALDEPRARFESWLDTR